MHTESIRYVVGDGSLSQFAMHGPLLLALYGAQYAIVEGPCTPAAWEPLQPWLLRDRERWILFRGVLGGGGKLAGVGGGGVGLEGGPGGRKQGKGWTGNARRNLHPPGRTSKPDSHLGIERKLKQ